MEIYENFEDFEDLCRKDVEKKIGYVNEELFTKRMEWVKQSIDKLLAGGVPMTLESRRSYFMSNYEMHLFFTD